MCSKASPGLALRLFSMMLVGHVIPGIKPRQPPAHKASTPALKHSASLKLFMNTY